MNITTRSVRLRKLADKILEKTPTELKKNVWITGSASIGISDRYSDLELVFIFDTIPDFNILESFVKSLGGIIKHEDKIENDWSGIGISFEFENEFIELNFTPKETILSNLQEAVQTACERDQVTLPWIIQNAICLKSDGFHEECLKLTKVYPKELQKDLMLSALENWDYEHHLDTMFTSATRGELPHLLRNLTKEIENLMRYLYALNMKWEPSYKWLTTYSKYLELKPKGLDLRLMSILDIQDPLMSVSKFWELVVESLNIDNPELNTSAIILSINNVIKKYKDISK